jgi:hypothetical protein
VPHASRHPALAALGLFFVILGAGQWVNGVEWGKYSLFFGLVFWLGVLYQWFSESVGESEGGQRRGESGKKPLCHAAQDVSPQRNGQGTS